MILYHYNYIAEKMVNAIVARAREKTLNNSESQGATHRGRTARYLLYFITKPVVSSDKTWTFTTSSRETFSTSRYVCYQF